MIEMIDLDLLVGTDRASSGMSGTASRVVVHVDCDAFYAQVGVEAASKGEAG